MTPQSRGKTAKTAVFRHRWQAWQVVRSIAAVRQRPRTPRNWRCSFTFFQSFLWHFNEKQRGEVIFRHPRPISCKNQENGAGKQWSVHAPLNKAFYTRLPFQMPKKKLFFVQSFSETMNGSFLNLWQRDPEHLCGLIWLRCYHPWRYRSFGSWMGSPTPGTVESNMADCLWKIFGRWVEFHPRSLHAY